MKLSGQLRHTRPHSLIADGRWALAPSLPQQPESQGLGTQAPQLFIGAVERSTFRCSKLYDANENQRCAGADSYLAIFCCLLLSFQMPWVYEAILV